MQPSCQPQSLPGLVHRHRQVLRVRPQVLVWAEGVEEVEAEQLQHHHRHQEDHRLGFPRRQQNHRLGYQEILRLAVLRRHLHRMDWRRVCRDQQRTERSWSAHPGMRPRCAGSWHYPHALTGQLCRLPATDGADPLVGWREQTTLGLLGYLGDRCRRLGGHSLS